MNRDSGQILTGLVWNASGLVALLAVGHLILGFAGILVSDWIQAAYPLLAGVALPAILARVFPRFSGRVFVMGMGLCSLLVPWGGGGILHPILVLGLAWIQLSTFMAGIRWGFLGAGLLLVDLILLHFAGKAGWVHEAPPPAFVLASYVTVLVVLVAVFVSAPLGVVHRFARMAQSSLDERRALEAELIRLNHGLETQVQERVKALESAREILHQGVEDLSLAYRDAIQGMREDAEILALGADGDADADWAGRRLALSCDRMERIHESFLRFCRIGEGGLAVQELTGRNLESIVMDAWSEVRHHHPGREFTFVLEPLSGTVADPDLLRQVWQNLLSNAAKYTAGKSPAWIRVASSGPWFLVEDNGAGFDPSSADRLFGLFLRLHRSGDYPGDGIGLATVRRIVERHGGIIQADARPDQGAIFRFRMDGHDDLSTPAHTSQAGWGFLDRFPDSPVVAKDSRTG